MQYLKANAIDLVPVLGKPAQMIFIVWLWSHGVVINDDIIGNFKVSTHLVITPAKVGISAHSLLPVVVQKHYHNIHEKERQHYI